MEVYTMVILILIITAMAVIGYLADKEGFGSTDGEPRPKKEKVKKEKKEKKVETVEEVEVMPLVTDSFQEMEVPPVDVTIPVETFEEPTLEDITVEPFEVQEIAEPILEVAELTPSDIVENDYTSDLGIFGEEINAKVTELEPVVMDVPSETEIDEIFHFEEVPVHEELTVMPEMEITADQQTALTADATLGDDMSVSEPAKTEEAIDDVWKF